LKFQSVDQRFILTNTQIDQCLQAVRKAAEQCHIEHRTLTRALLALEECLLNNQAYFGEGVVFSLHLQFRFGQLEVTTSLKGASFQPLHPPTQADQTDEMNIYEWDILQALDFTPRLRYANGTNYISFSLHPKTAVAQPVKLLLVLVAGVLTGLAGKVLPEQIRSLSDILFSNISEGISGLMNMAATPVIFLCVIYGILESGSLYRFKTNGIRILGKMMGSLLLSLIGTVGLCIAVYGIKLQPAGSGSDTFETVVHSVFSILPDNFLNPFVLGDNTKIIILGILIGCALLVSQNKADHYRSACSQLRDLFTLIMSWVGKLVPLLVYCMLVLNIWNGTMQTELFSAWRIVAVFFAVFTAAFGVNLIRTARRLQISPFAVARAVLPVGLKGLVTSSTLFCYSDMENVLKKRLQVSPYLSDFGLPLGLAFYQPMMLIYTATLLYFSEVNGISVQFGWLVSLLLVCFVTGIAVPPVTGGCTTLLAMLFSGLGFTRGLDIALPLLLLLDYPYTCYRTVLLILQLAGSDKRGFNLKTSLF